MTDLNKMVETLIAGDRRVLARAITLVESSREDHRKSAVALISLLEKKSQKQAIRIGLSGTPGVGKSTFIEVFGSFLTDCGLSVAVLAVDPSSARSGGSILGDKTRMTLLARNPAAFIRPSPSQTHLGGVARRTRETVAICEAAGFDVILIETVGVGQSETIVSQICDIFTLLLAPAGGDELQGVKRGIMELADLILINKADGDLKDQATRTCADYSGALRLLRKRAQDPEGFPKAMTISALEKDGISDAWKVISDLVSWRQESGHFELNRSEQSKFWLHEDIRYQLLSILDKDPIKTDLLEIAEEVASGKKNLALAVNEILKEISIKKGELG